MNKISNNQIKILLAGGGTGGPIAPLIAVADQIRVTHPQAHFLLLGTKDSFERMLADKYKLEFRVITAGKWRRYFSWRNLLTPFQVVVGIFQAFSIIKEYQPDVVFAAGGYISVPVMISARLLGKKILIHQQDVLPSLSNKILAPLADKITVTFEKSLKDFPSNSGILQSGKHKDKVIWTGNPFRRDILAAAKLDLAELKKKYELHLDLPVLLVMGGAIGATGLNSILEKALPDLIQYVQVIHITGEGKGINFTDQNYHAFEFTEDIGEIYAVSDLVVSRAGLSTITELAALKKVSILVPMPESHQETNAAVLMAAMAAVAIRQQDIDSENLIAMIRKLIYSFETQTTMRENISKIMPADAAEKIADLIINLCLEKK